MEILKEENYFFKLSRLRRAAAGALRARTPSFIQPESARNEVLNFVRQGLQDLSISRSTFDWGIPVPVGREARHLRLGRRAAELRHGGRLRREPGEFEPTFPADVHLVGKDILRFHAVIWPAMLMAHGLPLPGKIVANGWLMVGGEKMSKSNLTGIKPQDLTSHFGVDAYRWYFLRAIAFGQDGSFSWEDFSARYTSELANDYGNLASRVPRWSASTSAELPAATADGDAEQAVKDGLAKAVTEADRRSAMSWTSRAASWRSSTS